MASQYPYATPAYAIGAPTVWPIATTPQWPQESWERSPAGVVPPPKWNEVDTRPKDKDKKERDRDKKKSNGNSSSTTSVNNSKVKKEKEIEKEKVDEETKPLDLDTRIALLLKEKGCGGMAPPFLSLGVDSDDESKAGIEKSLKSAPIPTSIDSDDGN